MEGRLRARPQVERGDFCAHNNFDWRGVFALGLKLNVLGETPTLVGDFCAHNNFAWRGVFALGLKLNVSVAQTNKDAGRSRDEAFVRHVSVYVSLWA